MTRMEPGTSLLRLVLMISLALSGCSQPVPEPNVSADSSSDSSGPGAWEIACVVEETAVASADSAIALLEAAAAVWALERSSFRAYQRTFCDDCAMFEESAPQFFMSSANLVNRTAERFPSSASAGCAQGMMYLRNASLGEGRFDDSVLTKAAEAFNRALGLNPPSDLADRIRSELRDLDAMRPSG
jgi:hypothetical protein